VFGSHGTIARAPVRAKADEQFVAHSRLCIPHSSRPVVVVVVALPTAG